jgi:nucleoside transporter
VQRPTRWSEYAELAALFFIHAMAMGMWFVPLATVLPAYGYGDIKSLVFATGGVAAIISPLIFGAIADRHFAPVKVLRYLSLATAIAMALATTAISQHWGKWAVLAFCQLHALCSAPSWSLSTTIVLARLGNAKREFGPIRAMATLGWMVGCWIIGWMNADRTSLAGYGGTVVWLAMTLFTFVLPVVNPPPQTEHLTWTQRLGLDAWSLLKNRDDRVVFITAALFNMPLCAFYQFTPLHLQQLGLQKTSSWMTLGQVTEIIAMIGLAGLLTRFRLKHVFLAGIGIAILRYVLCAMDGVGYLLAGVTLHGFAFTLFFITAQLYLEQRIEPGYRARAQALLQFMLGGVGNLIGYLGTEIWFQKATAGGVTQWPLFWNGLAGAVAVIFVLFAVMYRGRKTEAGS